MAERMMKERNLQSVTAKSRLGNGGAKFLTYLFLLVMAVIVLFPFYWMIISSLKTLTEYRLSKPTFFPRTVMFSNYGEAFTTARLGRLFTNTLIVGVVSTLLSLVEKPSFQMRDTVEDQTMVREHQYRPIADCNLAGPIAYDLIMSKEAARLKGYDCPWCGEFDGIVVPNLISGNLLVKVLQHNAGATGCGILVGARIPIAICSRSDEPEQAYLSLAACAAMWASGKYF